MPGVHMKKYLAIFNWQTLVITCLSLVSTFLSVRYNFRIYADFLIFGIIIVFPLTFTMRADNQMWRLMFSRDAIFAGIGRESLRPVAGKTNRSDLAIVFSHATGARDFDVDLVVIGSPQYAALMARTQAVGVLERTRDPGGRYFGYY